MRRPRRKLQAALLATLLAHPFAAHGQQFRSEIRRTFGASLGVGSLWCQREGDTCPREESGARGVTLHGGMLISSDVAALAELWLTYDDDARIRVTHGIAGLALRIWPIGHRFWIQGGFGVARGAIDYQDDVALTRSEFVPAVTGAAGLELISRRRFAIDLALRAGSGVYTEIVKVQNVTVGLGFNWY